MAKEHCTTSVTHSYVKVEENQRKAVFRNPSRDVFSVTRVDGCVIPRGSTSADFLVVKPNSASVIVELKGRDVAHACDQVFATVENADVNNLIQGSLGFLVICSRYPRFDSVVARAKQKAARTYRAGFHVICGKGEFNIERCVAIDGPY